MSHSYSFILLHIIFSTKDRQPVLTKPIRTELFRYMIKVGENAGSQIVAIGGVSDHIHIAVRINRTTTSAKLVEKLKTSSSKWLKGKCDELANFSWQPGYAALSVGASGLSELARYIEHQEQHHKTRTFEEEFVMFLEKYNVPYDDQYLWN